MADLIVKQKQEPEALQDIAINLNEKQKVEVVVVNKEQICVVNDAKSDANDAEVSKICNRQAMPLPQTPPTQKAKTFTVVKNRHSGGLTQLTRDDFDGGPVSLDEIEPGLFLGNLTAASHMETLKSFKITHILTLDTVPLPQHIVEASFLTTKYVQIADMPREDLLHHLEQCVEFISSALAQQNNVLVHCYFGVSRSSSAVIAYIMKQHQLDYNAAFDLVKSKRRFVHPNAGFVAQLKLYKRMGCKIEPKYQKYKVYCLRLAGEQVRRAKILPQSFHNLIKPDPGITQTNPEPIVYRCRRCRRVLANKSHLLDHLPRGMPPPLMAAVPSINAHTPSRSSMATQTGTGPRLLQQIAAQIRKVSLNDSNTNLNSTTTTAATVTSVTGTGKSSPSLAAADTSRSEQQSTAVNYCHSILFIEPIAWMSHITHNTQGRLNCPKCEQKLGSFSWINGCQCPCGETMTPAFYLIPSKVELSKTVQNVQTTV